MEQATNGDQRSKPNPLLPAAAALGELTSLLVRSPDHAHFSIPDVEWLLMPAIFNRQYLLVHAKVPGKDLTLPAAAVLWASVSPEIDAQYRATPGIRLKLDSDQRKSGDNIWFTDLIGDRRLQNEAIGRLRAGVLQGRRVTLVNTETPHAPAIMDLMPQ
jgi:hemolysin-activating ACP:hemolysin acyltransferase